MTDRAKTISVIAGLFAVVLVLPTMLYVQQHIADPAPTKLGVLAPIGSRYILPDPSEAILARQRSMLCASQCTDAGAVMTCIDDCKKEGSK